MKVYWLEDCVCMCVINSLQKMILIMVTSSGGVVELEMYKGGIMRFYLIYSYIHVFYRVLSSNIKIKK